MSGWDQRGDIGDLEDRLRAISGREPLDQESEWEVTRIRRMFDAAKRRLGIIRHEDQ